MGEPLPAWAYAEAPPKRLALEAGLEPSDPILLTTQEAAALLRVCPKTIRRMAQRGQLRAVRVGRDLRFKREKILLFINSS